MFITVVSNVVRYLSGSIANDVITKSYENDNFYTAFIVANNI